MRRVLWWIKTTSGQIRKMYRKKRTNHCARQQQKRAATEGYGWFSSASLSFYVRDYDALRMEVGLSKQSPMDPAECVMRLLDADRVANTHWRKRLKE